MNIKKAIIPAAGYGTRMLPATKALPKEMLPLVDKPAIQFIVEEASAAGIKEILIIIGEHKYSIIDHFSPLPELESALEKSGSVELYDSMKRLCSLADISFIKQPDGVRGLGSAVLCAEEFAAGEPFAVLYGYYVVIGEPPAIGQLTEIYDKYGKGVVGVGRVSDEAVMSYCSLAVAPLAERIYSVSDMIEKPRREQIMSNFAILGRCVLPPEIFDILRVTQPGANGELQLTDAMRTLARSEGMIAVDYVGKRYDMGSKLGYVQAVVETALAHPQIGSDFRHYLEALDITGQVR